jgi:DedD protein
VVTKEDRAMPAAKEPGEPRNERVARPRRRLAANRGGNRLSRPLAAALLVIIAAGAYLFWPHSGSPPGGIGEHLTVITADTITARAPRSGSVDIQQEVKPVVAEKPLATGERVAAAATTPAPTTSPQTVTPVAEPVAQPTLDRAAAQPRTAPAGTPPSSLQSPAQAPAPASALIEPQANGAWAVQVGAYGNEANAEKAAAQLREQGISTQVRAASTSTGEMIYRVWIVWFGSREQAVAYARQERHRIGEGHPVHR